MEYLTTAEAATILGTSPQIVRRYIRDGKLPATPRGRDLFIARADVDAFIRQRPARKLRVTALLSSSNN